MSAKTDLDEALDEMDLDGLDGLEISADYAGIKRYAKANGCTVADLLALAKQNDPFYVGQPGQWRAARWFADLWQQFGFTVGVHLRRIHYRIVNHSEPVMMPADQDNGNGHGAGNGKPYLNTDECWKFLNGAGKYARYLGLIDPAAFVDRRSTEPRIRLARRDEDPEIVVSADIDFAFSLPTLPSLPDYLITGFESEQRYHLEIWVEKSTMEDVLIPICDQFGAVLVTGLGELSITRVVELVNRIENYQRPCRIFYISDFDPGGLSMPVAVARKIEFFIQSTSADVKLFNTMLTRAQCEHYGLPRIPIKETELRAKRFEELNGAGGTELDALEAIYPGEFERILSEVMSVYYDHDLDSEVAEREGEIEAMLDTSRDGIISEYQTEIDQLSADHATLSNEFAGRMADLETRGTRLWADIESDLENARLSIDVDDIPTAAEADEVPDPLFDSERDYLTQLAVYKRFQGK